MTIEPGVLLERTCYLEEVACCICDIARSLWPYEKELTHWVHHRLWSARQHVFNRTCAPLALKLSRLCNALLISQICQSFLPDQTLSELIWAVTRGPLLCMLCIGNEILPSYIGDCHKSLKAWNMDPIINQSVPIGSMYGIFTYICHENQPFM